MKCRGWEQKPGAQQGDQTGTETRAGGGLPASGSHDRESWDILKVMPGLADELEEFGPGGKSWEGLCRTPRAGSQ